MVGQLRFHEGILSLYLSMVDLDPSPLSLPTHSPKLLMRGGTGPTAAEKEIKGIQPNPCAWGKEYPQGIAPLMIFPSAQITYAWEGEQE